MGLIQEFQKADEERRREVKQLQDEVSTMFRDLRGQAQGRQTEVAAIAKEATAIVEAADTFVKDLVKSSAERASEVGKMRSEVANMFKDLAKGDTERRSTVTEYMHAEVGKIRSGVATMMKDLARGSAERTSEVAAIHKMVWGKAPAKKVAAPVAAALPRKAPAEKTVAEQAPAGELRDKVFTYLANHPDGTRLTELEEEFGVARIQTARVVRELMDGNKVEKRDLLYFTL